MRNFQILKKKKKNEKKSGKIKTLICLFTNNQIRVLRICIRYKYKY